MRKFRLISGICFAALVLLPQLAAAQTCSARHKACTDYCAKTFKDTAGPCPGKCATSLNNCKQTGCWVSDYENKCGYKKG